MATFEIKSPSGETFEVTAPDDASGDSPVTDFVSDTWQGAKDLYTGDKTRSVDIPEVPNIMKFGEGGGQLRAKMALARGDLGKLGVFRRFSPDAPARLDDFGNVIVELDGSEYYLNRPGFSGQDVADIATAALTELPFASRGGQLLKGLGTAGRAVGTGLGVGTGSLVQDMAARSVGSEQPVDLQTAGIAALTGGAFEFAAPLLKPFFSRFFKNPAMVVDGKVTDAGRKVLDRAGIDPDEITEEFAMRFRAMAKDAVDPNDLAGAARRARAAEFGIPLTRGDATGDVMQQGWENMASKGGYGEGAANLMTGFRTRQSDAVLGAQKGVQQSLGGQGINPLEGTGTVQAALLDASRGRRRAIRGAYDDAGKKKAGVLSEGVRDLAKQVGTNFRQNFNPATAPKAASLADQLSGFERVFPGRVRSINVKTLEQYRQQVSALTRSSDPIERAAAGNILRSYDDFMADTLDKTLVSGDDAALEAFSKARTLRRQFAKEFEGDVILDKLISEADGTLLLEPSEATRYLFGAGKLGGKTGATKALRRIKGILGEDSVEWQGLKEEAFLRLFPGDKAAIGKFPGAFDKVLKDSPELMRELFTGDEVLKLRRFRDVIANVTQKAPGAVNYSNTAATLSRLAQDVFGNSRGVLSFIARLPIAKDIARAGSEAVNIGRAKTATIPKRVVPPGVPIGMTGTAGSIMTTDDRKRSRAERLAGRKLGPAGRLSNALLNGR